MEFSKILFFVWRSSLPPLSPSKEHECKRHSSRISGAKRDKLFPSMMELFQRGLEWNNAIRRATPVFGEEGGLLVQEKKGRGQLFFLKKHISISLNRFHASSNGICRSMAVSFHMQIKSESDFNEKERYARRHELR
ncbi:hypothetical protein NPIL_181421 [Nephila pilipes]|uniref:Uncharacterized protein n=1 Tax=Nephila pilipes TaxID=299642 RepID=A0A8X6PX89_NEPPI|nr:hypothetical protein NPIL_181421 [Nephila pilipes]